MLQTQYLAFTFLYLETKTLQNCLQALPRRFAFQAQNSCWILLIPPDLQNYSIVLWKTWGTCEQRNLGHIIHVALPTRETKGYNLKLASPVPKHWQRGSTLRICPVQSTVNMPLYRLASIPAHWSIEHRAADNRPMHWCPPQACQCQHSSDHKVSHLIFAWLSRHVIQT